MEIALDEGPRLTSLNLDLLDTDGHSPRHRQRVCAATAPAPVVLISAYGAHLPWTDHHEGAGIVGQSFDVAETAAFARVARAVR
ncbi:MAG: hypothetical protein IT307_13370 [Chloroflexi bacterium]|nr:hypothetical protein [Chloroflexota bacterium]